MTQKLAGVHTAFPPLTSSVQQPDAHSELVKQFAAQTATSGLLAFTMQVEPVQQPSGAFVQKSSASTHDSALPEGGDLSASSPFGIESPLGVLPEFDSVSSSSASLQLNDIVAIPNIATPNDIRIAVLRAAGQYKLDPRSVPSNEHADRWGLTRPRVHAGGDATAGPDPGTWPGTGPFASLAD